MLKKKKKIFPLHIFLSNFNSFLSLPSLICFSISVLSSLRTQTPSLLSLPSLLGPVFGLWVQCLGRGWVVGPMFGSWVTAWVNGGCGCGWRHLCITLGMVIPHSMKAIIGMTTSFVFLSSNHSPYAAYLTPTCGGMLYLDLKFLIPSSVSTNSLNLPIS